LLSLPAGKYTAMSLIMGFCATHPTMPLKWF
jgi:hypothetical protein